MADSIPKGNTFESISLGSAIGHAKRNFSIPSISGRVPESVSATSDDDELDPEEFLSQELPQLLNNESNVPIDSLENLGRMGILNSTTIIGDKDANKYVDLTKNSNTISPVSENELKEGANITSSLVDPYIFNSLQFLSQNPFCMENSNSINFPKLNSAKSGEKTSLIKSLLDTNKLFQEELHKNIKIQKKLLANGEDATRTRSLISQNFKGLSESFYSLNELYSQDVSYKESLHENFKKWDNRREKILNKIASIKSNRNKHGSKLEKLLDESNLIDDEISDLERKLNALKTKKKVINAEVEDTSSVLESRTSKYVETFKVLERQGTEALIEFLNINNIPSSEFESFVRYIPVDVTFSNHYKQNLKTSVNKIQSIESTPSAAKDTFNDRNKTGFIGMQPFIVSEMLNNQNDTSLANNGHGLTPYEEGFEKGSKVSRSVRDQLNSFMKSLASNPEVVNDISFSLRQRIDDISNTINQKIDLESILKLLDMKEESSREVSRNTSEQATLYHDYGNIWNSVVDVIKSQESKLLSLLSESTLTKEILDEKIIFIMNSSLEKLKTLVSSLITHSSSLNPNSSTIYNNALFKSIIHEIKAICSALAMASGDKGYLEKVNEFKIFLSTDKPELNNNVTINQNQSRQHDTRLSSLNTTTIYRPTKTVPLTDITSINHLSSGSSSLSSDLTQEDSAAKFNVGGIDNKQGLFNLNSKLVKRE